MPTCCGHLTSPLRLDLTDHIRQFKTTAGMPAGPLTHYLNGVDWRHRDAVQKGDQLGDGSNTKDLNAFDAFGLAGLA